MYLCMCLLYIANYHGETVIVDAETLPETPTPEELAKRTIVSSLLFI